MPLAVAPDAYERYIGRYSRLLAPRFLDFAGIADGPVLDVGCGPGALTVVLAARLGPARVSAIDPSRAFAETCIARVPLADVRVGSGESLPFATGAFDAALSQLVVPLATDARKLVAESRRVVRRGGVVAACTFGAFPPEHAFWAAARRLDPSAAAPARSGGVDQGSLRAGDQEPLRSALELKELWDGAGLREVSTAELDVAADYADFDDFWSPLESGVGPAGMYIVKQPDDRRAAIAQACWEILGAPPAEFTLTARVIAIRGLV